MAGAASCQRAGDRQPDAHLAPYVQEEPLSLAQLQDFLRNPVRHFFSQRLKVFFEAPEVPLADEEPFVLDALATLRPQRQPARSRAGASGSPSKRWQAQAKRLQASGLLPMAGFGECLQRELIEPLPICCSVTNSCWRFGHRRSPARCLSVSICKACASKDGSAVCTSAPSGGLLSVSPRSPTASVRSSLRKWHRLTRPGSITWWPAPVAMPLTTALVASDDSLLLAPLPQEKARPAAGRPVAGLASGHAPASADCGQDRLCLAGSDRSRQSRWPPRARPMRAMACTTTASAAKVRPWPDSSPTSTR